MFLVIVTLTQVTPKDTIIKSSKVFEKHDFQLLKSEQNHMKIRDLILKDHTSKMDFLYIKYICKAWL